MDLVQIAKDNWSVIEPAIWQFIAAIVVAFLIGWGAARQRYDDRLATAGDRLAHRDEQIRGLQQRIEILEKKESGDHGPPELDPEQFQSIETYLNNKAKAGKVMFVTDTSGISDSKIPAQLRRLFKNAKWTMSEAVATDVGPGNRTADGVFIVVSPQDGFWEDARAIQTAFDNAGVRYVMKTHGPDAADLTPMVGFTRPAGS